MIAAAVVVYAVVMGAAAGGVWQSKGGTFGAGFLAGLLLGVFGLFYVAFARPQRAAGPGPEVGDTVVLSRGVRSGGSRVPAGFKGRVLAVDVIDGTIMVKVSRADQADLWVSPGVLRVVRRAADRSKVCPDCSEPVRVDARVCRWCGFEFEPA